MKSGNLYNSKIFKFFDYVLRLVLINLLIVIPSFLFLILFSSLFPSLKESPWSILLLIPTFLYLYPGICAGARLIIRYELKETNTVFKEFFKGFLHTYLKAFLETIFITILLLLFANSFVFFYNHLSEGIIYILGFIIAISFSLFLAVILIHLPLVMTYMDGCNIIDDMKLAAMMAFNDLFITIAMVVVIGLAVFLCVTYDTFLIIGGISLPLYLLIKLTFKKYYIVYIRSRKDFENKLENEKNKN